MSGAGTTTEHVEFVRGYELGKQTAYSEGHTAGRKVGFESGEKYGRGMQRMEDELKPLIGFGVGVLVAEIVCLAAHALGWFS